MDAPTLERMLAIPLMGLSVRELTWILDHIEHESLSEIDQQQLAIIEDRAKTAEFLNIFGL